MDKEDIISEYKKYLKIKNYSERTIKKYEKHIYEFLNYLEKEEGIRRVADITREKIRKFISKVYTSRRQRDGKAVSVSLKEGKVTAIKNFFKYLVRTQKILYNPSHDIETPRRSGRKMPEVLKEKEIIKLLESIKGAEPLDLRNRAMLETFYSTGIRNNELRNIKVCDVDLESGEVIIREGKGYFGKRERVVPLGRMATAYVEEYLKTTREKLVKDKRTEILFVNYKGDRLSRESINKMVKQMGKRAGLKKEVKAHMLRHTCATHFLKGGADIRYVQELLGHRNLESTKVYTKIEISRLKQVHKRSHPRERR